ncbi:putative protein [Abditibacteriota bacterium]|nr:putative protein [Abditibacteriota bacterium]
MIRMTIEGIGFDHYRQTVVVLKDPDSEKLLPIWIGPAEARAIQIELEGARPVRPMSHDLMLALIEALRGRVTRIVINDLLDSTFYATIDVDTPAGTRHIDARPSDAIALAVRAKCPIFVDGGAENALVDAEAIQGTPDSDAELPELPAEETGGDDEINRFRRLLGEE